MLSTASLISEYYGGQTSRNTLNSYHILPYNLKHSKVLQISKNTIHKYGSAIGLYFGASLIPMVLNMLINPLIAINMSPDDYAIVGYYTAFNTLITPIIVFYMLHFYNKCFFEFNDAQRIVLKATIFKALIVFSGFLSVICFGGIILYTVWFNADSSLPLFPYVALSVFAIPFTGILSLAQTDYRMQRKAKSFFTITVSSGVTQVALILLLVVLLKLGATGKLLATLITNVIFFAICCIIFKDLFKVSFDRKLFKDILKFCWPLTIAAFLGFFFNGYDKVFLERLGDNTQLGYYTVGVSIAGYIAVFQTAISSTFQPDIYESVVKRDKLRLLKIIGMMVFATSFIVLAFIVFAPFVIKILTAGRYMQSVGYAQIVSLSTITAMVYYSISQVIIALGYTKLTLLNKIISSLLAIGLFSLLINNFQFTGAAWGLVGVNLISTFGLAILYLIYRHGSSNLKNRR